MRRCTTACEGGPGRRHVTASRGSEAWRRLAVTLGAAVVALWEDTGFGMTHVLAQAIEQVPTAR